MFKVVERGHGRREVKGQKNRSELEMQLELVCLRSTCCCFFLSLASHVTSESRRLDQIPGPIASQHFSSETCFHLVLHPKAVEGSCSPPSSHRHSGLSHKQKTLLVDGRRQKIPHEKSRWKTLMTNLGTIRLIFISEHLIDRLSSSFIITLI